MTSWAKNRIAKHLARFAKNIEPSQISLKFLRGEGELLNLELNEQVLTDLLELPPWLQLTKATCNRICAKIHWTSLKTDPIRLYLDCVEVEILASEEARQKAPSNVPSHPKSTKEKPATVKATKYGFAEKVVDGMFVSINTVMVNFKASGFKASFSMSRLIIQSTAPDWQVPSNLRKTRIKDEQRGQVLIFKEIRWGTMRLDADASYIEASSHGSLPLRLITNNSIIRLTIKKHLHDCSLVSSKLEIILDDILWVLTQSQLLKLSSFVHFILKVRQKFLPLSPHSDVPRPSSNSQSSSSSPAHKKSSGQYQGQGGGSNLNQLFTEYDVEETSYHLRTKRIDLHLCDDQTLDGDKHPSSSSKTKTENKKSKSLSDSGGALLISITDIRLDHYPYHIAGLRRKGHRNDEEARFCRRQWAQQLFDFFLKTEGRTLNSQHSRNTSHSRRPIMHESFFIISCCSFAIMEVTTGDHQEPKPFLSSEKEALFLPAEMNALYFDFTTYYFLGNINLPVPPSNMFLKLNPIQLTFHPLTCVWLNKFVQSVVAGFEWTKEFMTHETGPPEHLDLRIETLMPKVTIPYETDPSFPHQEERPKALQMQISQAVISNSRIGAVSSQSDLLMDLQNALASKVYSNSQSFPSSPEDMSPLSSESWVNDYSIVHRSFALSSNRSPSHANSHASPSMEEPRLIWCIWCEQLWLDFIGIENSSGRPVTFVDAVPLRFWISLPVLIPKPIQNQLPSVDHTANENTVNNVTSRKPSNVGQTVHFSNASSTISLPGDFNSSHTFSVSLSGASSNSSLSVDSPESELRARHSIDGVFGLNGDSHNRINAGHNFTDSTDSHPLRTSYSESDLLPAEHFHQNRNPDAISLQEYKATLPPGDSEPPPPYYSESPSLQRLEQRNRANDLPYGLPPAYDSLTSEDQSNAPPLPKKASLVSNDNQRVKDLFMGNSPSHNSVKKLPTVSGLLQIAKPTNVQLDHFQLLFLLRLQEMFSEVMETISEDTERFQQMQSPIHKNAEADSANASFSLHLSVPAVDVNLIIPSSNGISEEQLMSLADRIKCGKVKRLFEVFQSGSGTESERKMTDASSFTSLDTELDKSLYAGKGNNESEEYDANTTAKSDAAELQPKQAKDIPVLIADQYSHGDSPDVKSDRETPSERQSTLSPVDSTSNDALKADSPVHQPNPHRDRKILKTHESLHEDAEKILNEPESNEVQRDVSVLFSNELDDSSGISSTSDSPLSSARPGNECHDKTIEGEQELHDQQDGGLCNTTEEVKVPIVTSEISTQTDRNEKEVGQIRNEDRMVSVVCLKCSDIKLSVQTVKPNSLVKIIVNHINLKENGNIKYNMTLDHRLSSAAANAESEKTDYLTLSNTKPQVRIRIVSGPIAEAFAEGSRDLGYAHIKVDSLNAALLLSNAENLGEFAEDEFLMPTLPFKVELNECDFRLLDDKPRRYLSAPSPPPLEVSINSLCVHRSIDGKITIREGTQEQSATADRTIVANFLNENEGNEALSDPDSSDDSRSLFYEKINVVQDENDRLLQDLKLANARIVSLEEERNAILKVVEKLQQELMWSNNENDKLSDKIRHYKQYLRGLSRT